MNTDLSASAHQKLTFFDAFRKSPMRAWGSLIATMGLAVIIPMAVGFGVGPEQTLTMLVMLEFAKRISYFPGFLLVLIFPIVAYLPAGIIYGKLNVGVLASLMETNPLEAQEFILTMPPYYYILALILIAAALVWFMLRSQQLFNVNKNKLFLFIFVGLFFHSAVFKFYKYAVENFSEYYEAKTALAAAMSVNPEWHVTELQGERSDLYVVIIGESVRKDYMSVYGYPHQTTPFLNSVPGYFIDGYVSASSNTWASLPRALSLSRDNGLSIDPAHNAVTLANAAGLETYWISNQGFLGSKDTGVSIIAARSMYQIYLKKGEYNSENIDDLVLLEKLQSVLGRNDGRKVIFLHMMGSHPHECQRLHGFVINFDTPYGERFNCYLASIEKTDSFIAEAHSILQKSGKSFSLLYFSDHGMTATKEGSHGYRFKHGENYRENYEVPFLLLNSEDVEHVVQKKRLSALHFMGFFTDWIKVRTSHVPVGYDIRAAQDDQEISVYNFSRLIDYNSLSSQESLK